MWRHPDQLLGMHNYCFARMLEATTVEGVELWQRLTERLDHMLHEAVQRERARRGYHER